MAAVTILADPHHHHRRRFRLTAELAAPTAVAGVAEEREGEGGGEAYLYRRG